MKFKKFIRECREHNVLKNLSIYIVSSWVLLQVIALIAEPLGFSTKAVAYGLILLLIGFPLYIYGVWRFQLAPQLSQAGPEPEDGAATAGKSPKSPFQKLYFSFLAIITLVCTGIVLALVNQNLVRPGVSLQAPTGNKIAVLRFENLTGDPSKNLIGEMAVDWIIHGITRNKLGQVISPEIIEDYSKVLRASMVPDPSQVQVTEYLKPSKIIEGDYYLSEGRMLFQCSITDEVMNRTLVSFEPVSCDADTPLECIEALSQRILGFFIDEERAAESLEEHPPKYEAYELFSKAKTWWNEDDQQYLKLLNEAIAADQDFFEPKAFRFMYYFNRGIYPTADSLLRQMKQESGLYFRQQILLNLYEALLEGNHRNAYKYQEQEYHITPMHLETNSNMMVFSLQFTNRPEAIDSLYREIDMSEMDLSQCAFCVERYKIKAMSDIDLGNEQAAIRLLEPLARQDGFWILKKILLRAYVRSGQWEEGRRQLETWRIVAPVDTQKDLMLFGAREFLREGRSKEAREILKQALELPFSDNPVDAYLKGELLFYNGNYQEALPYLEEGYGADPADFNYGALLAISLEKLGRAAEAQQQLQQMESLKAPYQYGELPYSLAMYYAATGQVEACLDQLLKAIAEGHWYETSAFQNDPLLRPVYNTPGFEAVMNYWK
ncbi:hypothetical protein OZ410_02490 [Robiginitalea sp. M366]|uniref:tetratricopeptide repeat protein n=1 Tax=Robiginitalea aestuariiviva TaxID=3036903 RepID=UPI00240CE931|nr:hypothetical protein [Robiginitalea aestuariiviva]MDG1571167.1 hypothetical protein [Robiginitalea aestuariiviva]